MNFLRWLFSFFFGYRHRHRGGGFEDRGRR
jgi:hypothetical protein